VGDAGECIRRREIAPGGPAAPATALEIGHAVTVEILRNTCRIALRRTALALGWCRRSVRAEQATIGATVQGAHGGLHVLAFGGAQQ
jgi:hypothetical protein